MAANSLGRPLQFRKRQTGIQSLRHSDGLVRPASLVGVSWKFVDDGDGTQAGGVGSRRSSQQSSFDGMLSKVSPIKDASKRRRQPRARVAGRLSEADRRKEQVSSLARTLEDQAVDEQVRTALEVAEQTDAFRLNGDLEAEIRRVEEEIAASEAATSDAGSGASSPARVDSPAIGRRRPPPIVTEGSPIAPPSVLSPSGSLVGRTAVYSDADSPRSSRSGRGSRLGIHARRAGGRTPTSRRHGTSTPESRRGDSPSKPLSQLEIEMARVEKEAAAIEATVSEQTMAEEEAARNGERPNAHPTLMVWRNDSALREIAALPEENDEGTSIDMPKYNALDRIKSQKALPTVKGARVNKLDALKDIIARTTVGSSFTYKKKAPAPKRMFQAWYMPTNLWGADGEDARRKYDETQKKMVKENVAEIEALKKEGLLATKLFKEYIIRENRPLPNCLRGVIDLNKVDPGSLPPTTRTTTRSGTSSAAPSSRATSAPGAASPRDRLDSTKRRLLPEIET